MERMYANNVDFPVKTQVRNSKRPERGSTEEQCLVCNVELTMRGDHLYIAKREIYSRDERECLPSQNILHLGGIPRVNSRRHRGRMQTYKQWLAIV